MDVTHLTEVELTIECEVRGLTADEGPNKQTELQTALKTKLEEERVTPSGPLLKPHEAAKKNPKKELKACATRLSAIKQHVVQQTEAKVLEAEDIKKLESTLAHVHGRLARLTFSPCVQTKITAFFKAHLELIKILKKFQAQSITVEESILEATGVVIPNVNVTGGTDKPKPTRRTRSTTRAINSNRRSIASTSNRYGFVQEQGDSEDEVVEDEEEVEEEPLGVTTEDHQQREDTLINSLGNLKVELEDQIVAFTEGRRTSGQSAQRTRRESQVSEAWMEDDRDNIELPLNAKVCRDPSTWNLKYEGRRSTLPVERFFYRVERMATKSRIRLNNLVDYMNLLLEGEALEWYWVYLERHRNVTWELLKREMIQRFQASRSDDDVRRLLSQRKQIYSKESFLDFHDAILKLALQSQRPITDQEIYNILRRNMRPGLQLELYDTKSFPSVAHFVRKCVALEDLWKRFGVNPEAKLSMQQGSYISNMGNYNNQNYQSNRFVPRQQPRVYEVVHENVVYEDEQGEDQSEDQYEQYEDEEQICEINNQQRRFQQQGRPQQQLKGGYSNNNNNNKPQQRNYQTNNGGSLNKPSFVKIADNNQGTKQVTCYNCQEQGHTFYDCRKPVSHVFCFGCGANNIYKPDCKRCNESSGNHRTEVRISNQGAHLQNTAQQQPIILQKNVKEDTASNTDTEFYRRKQ